MNFTKNNSKNIAIFASGSGSNAERIVEYFKNHSSIKIAAVFTNNPKAGVIDRMRKFYIPVYLFNKEEFIQTQIIPNTLKELQVDLIVLAGFLWLIPENVLDTEIPMINIHPSLLPKYGGKGMYGHFVHSAVIQNKENETGITIHKVTKEYDKGEVLFQAKIKVEPTDSAETLANKIHKLEHDHFPLVIENLLSI